MCQLCMKYPCDNRCPNHIPKKAIHYCSICGEGVYDGEEYIVNMDGEYRHFDCFQGMRELLGWLGHEVLTMEED